ncbi:MAG: hypothetical protein COV30_01600 [Candidatus Yanofskybacteria bacterium CG10_big_fil_rev_8_21_14_0_10_37_15]|uniref:Holliday junction branch migration complex subunit RuvA n=1 Tax=Candidatus Yanofskybacteria bacterium CG10_big_fil_rev_8_21_14_0_10_37_15 TaxID=1975097 RepID=A0A2H0R696_9BACT|nr:MAG: hypothetical protein COV30_01600 [Candidatus Yanofskybacteria bacterium CG10_big_fil_rev_8_21_14_0_10_37_15]
MISFLEGIIEHYGDKYVILNAGGVGYKVIVSPKLLNILSKPTLTVKTVGVGFDPEPVEGSKRVRLFVHSRLNMREGTFDIYGFKEKSDLDLFYLVTGVSGIGPKGAMNVLASIDPKELKTAVVNEDSGYLKKISGLGSKIAQRLVLELKNKVDYIDSADVGNLDLGREGQAMDALIVLGYSAYQAKEALKDAGGDTLEEKVRGALKILAKK